MGAVDNRERASQFGFSEFLEEPAECELGHLDGGRPHPQAHHPMVAADWEGALVGEVLVEGDDQGVGGLGPLVDFTVALASQADLVGMPGSPAWIRLPQPVADRLGDRSDRAAPRTVRRRGRGACGRAVAGWARQAPRATTFSSSMTALA